VLAYPTRTFKGTVTQVRQNPTTVQNVVTYTTVVLVDNRDGALRPGMTANAMVHVAKLDDATIVPLAALQWRPSADMQSRIVGPDGKPLRRRSGAAGSGQGGNAHAAGRSAAGSSGSPWGSTGGGSAATIVAGSRARLFVSDGAKLRMVPVEVEMVSGSDAAVSPLRGSLAQDDTVVVGGGSPSHARNGGGNNPFGANRPGGGARIPGGGGFRG
jgi:HlyD family secretion protein